MIKTIKKKGRSKNMNKEKRKKRIQCSQNQINFQFLSILTNSTIQMIFNTDFKQIKQ